MSFENLRRAAAMVAASALFFVPMASWGSLADAETAYENGDYYGAYLQFVPLAKSGDATAQAAIGRIYLEGKGAPKDSRTAAISYEKAAAQGHAGAQFQLARLLLVGVGVKADAARAAQWMEKSADQGVAWAMEALGGMYKDGTGVPKDPVQAYKWLSLAAASEAPVAAEYAARAKAARIGLESSMNAEQIAAAQKLATDWRAVKKARDTQWTKVINLPVALAAPSPAPSAESKTNETTPLTKDYFPRN